MTGFIEKELEIYELSLKKTMTISFYLQYIIKIQP